MLESTLPGLFHALTGTSPFPWQEALLERFLENQLPSALDIPTGLGKTSVMAIWLIALAQGAKVPRRLIYIVDRRAVVDQATKTAEKLKTAIDQDVDFQKRLGLEGSFPISTLRGQQVDNREWLRDPASPAIIVGTVDMIGSRLLFEGYGVSRKMRPYHAGLLGADTLVILDEAHLVPPFEKLLEQIADPASDLKPSDIEHRELVPNLNLLSLSATGRSSRDAFTITEADLKPGTITHQRLTAAKRLKFQPLGEEEKLADALARNAWELTSRGSNNTKIIVFSNSREIAEKAKEAVQRLADGNKKEGTSKIKIESELLVGGRRVHEREVVSEWLETHGFFGGTKLDATTPRFVFATSAGEVGVDLDADHLVCDLVTWERMVQRLGRVNRRGEGSAKIIVVTEPEPKPSKAVESALAKPQEKRDKKEQKALDDYQCKLSQSQALSKPFDLLPRDDEGIDVSPGALRELKLSASIQPENETELAATERLKRRELIDAATSEAPLYPALSRAVIDAWSMTSLLEHTGRPRIQPWLRGWVKEEPQTTILWRTHLPFVAGEREISKPRTVEIEAFFEAAPPHASELLQVETATVISWLTARAVIAQKANVEAGDHPPQFVQPIAVVLEPDGTVSQAGLRLIDFLLDQEDKKRSEKRENALFEQLAEHILVLDSRFAGLSSNGLLDEFESALPKTLDGTTEWLRETIEAPKIRFRVRTMSANGHIDARDPNWSSRFQMPLQSDTEGEASVFLIVEKWRGEIEAADDATEPDEQKLDEHQELVAEKARLIAKRVSLPREYANMLEVVAKLHDEGKRHSKWQDAFSAPRDGRPFAKTRGPINLQLLDGYRHEFASVATAAKSDAIKAMPDEMRDLALHLIVAHHGFSRPLISPRGCPDAPPSVLEERAREAALRFARLQHRWGPWALAWWESLLRAADHQASGEAKSKSSKNSNAPSHD